MSMEHINRFFADFAAWHCNQAWEFFQGMREAMQRFGDDVLPYIAFEAFHQMLKEMEE